MSVGNGHIRRPGLFPHTLNKLSGTHLKVCSLIDGEERERAKAASYLAGSRGFGTLQTPDLVSGEGEKSVLLARKCAPCPISPKPE